MTAVGTHRRFCAAGIALKALIEQTVNATGKPAVLISHSMGGLQTLYFLNGQTAAWKQQYVQHWIAISAPFGLLRDCALW